MLAPLGLRLAAEKTRVCSIDEGFDFLGWHIRRRRKRGTGKHYVYTYPSKRAILAIRRKVRTLTRRTSQPNLRLLLLRVNAALRGWANYFKHGVSKRCFGRLGSFAWRRVVRWLRQRHLGLNWTAIRRRFLHGWEIVCDGITLYNPATVAITRYRYRGARDPQPLEPHRRHRRTTRGEPDALKGARPVRRAGRGNGAAERPPPRLGPTPTPACGSPSTAGAT